MNHILESKMFEEVKDSIEMELTKLYKKILAKKTVRTALYLTFLLFYPGIIVAVIVADAYSGSEYNIFNNYISDLGTHQITPAPFIFNTILIITGVVFIPIYFYLEEVIVASPIKKEKNNRSLKFIKIIADFGKISFLIGSISMIGAGVFNEHYYIHSIFAMLIFGGIIAGGCSTGLIIIVNKTIIPKVLGYTMFLSSIVFFTLNMLKIFPMITSPFMEWCVFLSIVIWFFPTTVILLNYQDKCLEECLKID